MTDRPRAEAVPFTQIRRQRAEWLLPGRIPRGMLSLLIGDPGLGKSLLTCLLAAQLSQGELLGEQRASILLTAEDSLGATIRPRLEAAAARLELVHGYVLRGPDGDDEGGLVIPDDVDQLEQLVDDTKSGLVVIDPLGAHLPATINAWQDQSVRRALSPLSRVAESTGAAIVAVLHLNRRESTDALRRINGSTGFGAAARSVMLFARDPDDPDGETGRRRVLSHEKCNVGPLADGQVYEVEQILLPARADEPEVSTARLRFTGETARRGGDLLGGSEVDHERSALGDAEDFLREELALGPRPAKDIQAAARAAGILPRTLQRARQQVCHKPKKAGFSGGWEWALKQQPLFPREDSQPPWPSSSNGEVGHLRTNPHGESDSGAADGPKSPEDGHTSDMAIFDVGEAEKSLLGDVDALVANGHARWVR